MLSSQDRQRRSQEVFRPSWAVATPGAGRRWAAESRQKWGRYRPSQRFLRVVLLASSLVKSCRICALVACAFWPLVKRWVNECRPPNRSAFHSLLQTIGARRKEKRRISAQRNRTCIHISVIFHKQLCALTLLRWPDLVRCFIRRRSSLRFSVTSTRVQQDDALKLLTKQLDSGAQ